MTDAPPTSETDAGPRPALSAYLLGRVDFRETLALQRRLVYDVSGDPTTAALILCEHPPRVTIGREGSRSHVRLTAEQLTSRGWEIDWVARGGGVTLFSPGQVVGYVVAALPTLRQTPAGFVRQLTRVVADVTASFGTTPTIDPDRPGVLVRGRRLAQVGVAVRHRVTSFGFVYNVQPDLALWHDLLCDRDARPMTSLQRECRGTVRTAAVRERFLERLAAALGSPRLSVFHHHPTLSPRTPRHAFTTPRPR